MDYFSRCLSLHDGGDFAVRAEDKGDREHEGAELPPAHLTV